MDWVIDLLKEPAMEGIGGGAFILILYKVIERFLTIYGKREDTEQAEAEAQQTQSEALIAKEETQQKLIGVLADVATANKSVTDGMMAIKDALLEGTTQIQNATTSVGEQGGKIDSLVDEAKKFPPALDTLTQQWAQTESRVDDSMKATEESTNSIVEALQAMTNELKVVVEKVDGIYKMLDTTTKSLEDIRAETDGVNERVEKLEADAAVITADIIKETSENKTITPPPGAQPIVPAKIPTEPKAKEDKTND